MSEYWAKPLRDHQEDPPSPPDLDKRTKPKKKKKKLKNSRQSAAMDSGKVFIFSESFLLQQALSPVKQVL